MYVYNVTFMVDRLVKDDFVSWFRNEALTDLVNAESPARSPRLTLVADVPGDPEFTTHAASFAFQVEFPALAIAHQWAETYLAPLLGKYTAKFGQEKAVSFATILENIDL